MKKTIRIFGLSIITLLAIQVKMSAQKIDDERMKRDIEVAENVLSTLVKQEFNQQRSFFGFEVKGIYLPGYGVTLRIPGDRVEPYMIFNAAPDIVVNKGDRSFSYSYSNKDENDDDDNDSDDGDEEVVTKLKEKSKQKRKIDKDSLRDVYNLKLIKASKDFIVDYGDFLSQLGPNEKIVITNRGSQDHGWFQMNSKRTYISVECLRSDIVGVKQGKLSRDQAMAKIKVVNAESVNEKEPDMELMSSIFNRLYRADLSKTYFMEDNLYYERLKDYGVMYYMQVFSSNQKDDRKYSMPTVDLDDVNQETRDKKVVELYPKFEQELKENILEYGRTLKSLKDDEVVVFNVVMTKCKGCGIPSNIELSIKNAVLKDYGAGKIDKNTGLSKFTVKKGSAQ